MKIYKIHEMVESTKRLSRVTKKKKKEGVLSHKTQLSSKTLS